MPQANLATPKEVVEIEINKGHNSLDGWKEVMRKGSKSAPFLFPAGLSGGNAATEAGVITAEAEVRTTKSAATAASTRLDQDGRGNAST